MDPKRTPKPGAGAINPQGQGPKRPGAPAPGASAEAGRRGPGISEAIDQLSREIQQLRVDYERFFNGALPFPPEELRNRILNQLRQLRGSTSNTAVDNFRLGDLEARFNSYGELYNRRLRDLEEGRHPQARQAPPPAARRFDPAQGVVLGDRIDPEAVQALFQGLVSSPGDTPRFDLDSFQSYLVRQVAAIREKTGCSQVQFRLATEDGKVKLKARPVTGESS